MGKSENPDTAKRGKVNEWELFRNKFGKYAYIVFPLVHIIGLAVVAGIVYLVVQLFK